jgi:tripartite-type tricarboxylate transporter receptor subunit TctC
MLARRLGMLGLGLAMVVWGPAPVAAQTYPTRPVRIINGYAAGGGMDVTARLLAQHLSVLWGQSVVIENKPGAAGMIGAATAAQATPDGYTLLVVTNTHAVDPLMHKRMAYDPFRDFTPIAQIGFVPNVLLASKAAPWRTLGEFMAVARAKPGTISYGAPGLGAPSHLSAALFLHMAGLDLVAVQYKGGALSLQAVIAGEVPVSMNNLAEAVPQVAAGTVRALGVATTERVPQLPDAPTIAEQGVPGYEAGIWYSLLGPAGLPQPIVAKVHGDLMRVLALDEVKTRLAALAVQPHGAGPDAVAARMRAENDKWGPIIKAAKIELD